MFGGSEEGAEEAASVVLSAVAAAAAGNIRDFLSDSATKRNWKDQKCLRR